MEHFGKWIDAYKLKPEWSLVIENNNIKYHHLPIEMQVGIFYRYISEVNYPGPSLPSDFLMIHLFIRNWFGYSEYKKEFELRQHEFELERKKKIISDLSEDADIF